MWMGSPFSVRVWSLLMKSVLEGQGGCGGCVAKGVFDYGVEVEDDRGVGFLHACSLYEVRVVGEFAGVSPFR